MLKNLFHIIRWPNLLMLAGIQLLIYFRLLVPDHSVLTIGDLGLLILITILAGASGYVINDYYDRDIDKVNKPERWIAGNVWPLPAIRAIFYVLILLGLGLSLWLSWRLSLVEYIFIYPLAITGLWFYSYALKCKPVIGNLWVSIFCAAVVGIIALPDLLLDNAGHIKMEIRYYIAFAFLSTWYREVVKDLEDFPGDTASNCNTAVVRYGIKTGKVMAMAFGLLLVTSLLLWDAQQENQWVKLVLNILQGFTVGSMAFVWWAKNKTYYHHASTVMKLIMIGGTLTLLIS